MKSRSESGMSVVSPAQWSELTDSDFPFSEHDFLSALEETDCVGEETALIPDSDLDCTIFMLMD